MHVQDGVRRSHQPRSKLESHRSVSAGDVGVRTLGDLAERKPHALGREIPDRTMVGIERDLRIESFRIDIRIEGKRRALPGERELACRKREPVDRFRIVGNVAAIEADCLAVKEVGERLVGRGGIPEAAGSDVYAADEIIAEASINAEAGANASTVAVRHSLLQDVFTADPNVSTETEAAEDRF